MNSGITATDFLKKMFLQSGKNIETNLLAHKLLDDFERTVSERPQAVSEVLIKKCHETTDRFVTMIQESEAEIKADFSLYQTF